MAVDVPTLYEPQRGCGYRKAGGLYLMSGGLGEPCSRLPVELNVCPVCAGGIKQSRGWTWVNGQELIPGEWHGDELHRNACPLEPLVSDDGETLTQSELGETTGLLWVGEKFYTPDSFTAEARAMGVSKRIAAVPRGLALGKTWVLLAHPHAVSRLCPGCEGGGCEACEDSGTETRAGVFHVFRPTHVEYVVTGEETEEELESMVKRGIRPVRVEPIEQELPLAGEG